MSTERLLEIKRQIEKAKTSQAEIKGQISGIEEQMEKKFKIKTISAAEKELKKRGADLDKMEMAFDKGVSELEAAHEWD